MYVQNTGTITKTRTATSLFGYRNSNEINSFAASLARKTSLDENQKAIARDSITISSKTVDPVKVYEEMTMQNVSKVQRSSKVVEGVTWDDETLAHFAGLGHDVVIDTTKSINWDATGEATLTDEQIAELRNKYNLENLSPQHYYDLMADLTNMNAISAEDIHSMHLATAPPMGLYPAGTAFSSSKPFSIGNIFDNIDSELGALNGLNNFMLSDEFWKMNPNSSKEEHSDYIKCINDRTKRFNKLMQTLAAIRG